MDISKNHINFYTVSDNETSQRIDNFLLKILKGVPKSHIYRIIRSGEVRINKKRCESSYKLQVGDIIRIPPIRIATPELKLSKHPPKPNFEILFEDDYYLIINKSSGVACHGGSGISFGVIEQYRVTKQYKFLELAHRLDKETSGILIMAKKRFALTELQEQMKANRVCKEYYALTIGKWRDSIRNVKAPIYKFTNKDGERRVCIDHEKGQFSHTIFSVVQIFDDYTLVNADLHTGRTHQIRIHSQHLGFPIVGDEKYGDFELNKLLHKNGLKRMFLHAHHIKFKHPVSERTIDINCNLTTDLRYFLTGLSPNINI